MRQEAGTSTVVVFLTEDFPMLKPLKVDICVWSKMTQDFLLMGRLVSNIMGNVALVLDSVERDLGTSTRAIAIQNFG